MAFGSVSIAALERAVRRTLPEWRLPAESDVALLSVSENATFLLGDPRNEQRLVLRVHRPGYHGLAEIRSELAWIAALRAEAGIATPAPVPVTDGKLVQEIRVIARRERSERRSNPEPRHGASLALDCFGPLRGPRNDEAGGREWQAVFHAVAFEYLAGAEPDFPDRAQTFRALGAVTARLHRHARGWERPVGFTRKTWNFDSMLGSRRPLWGDWRAGPGLDRAGAALLERTAECLRARLARFGASADRFGLIHADLRLANLLAERPTSSWPDLVRPSTTPLTVIDFDDCGFGWFAYDFAAAVSFFENDPAVPDLLASWLDGYRTVAPFAREDEAEIPTFVMLRRMLLLAWIGSHPEAAAARELAPTFAAGTVALGEAFLSCYGSASAGRAYSAKERARIS